MKNAVTHSFFFSPTGGTAKIARLFGFPDQGEFVDITSRCEKEVFLTADDFAVFSVPSYGGRIPSPVYERMKHIRGNGTPCAVIAVFGNRAVDDAGLEMANLVKEHGFLVIGYGEFVAPHSVNKKFASNRPDEKDEKIIGEFRNAVKAKLESDSLTEIDVPGNMPYREYNGIPLKPLTGNGCTGCGKCVSFCPAKAIRISSGKSVTDKAKCISCMGCQDICPVQARRIPTIMRLIASFSLSKLCSGRKESHYLA